MSNARNWLAPAICGLALVLLFAPATALGQQAFNGNPLVLDGQGKLLSWIQPQGVAYGRVVELAWSGLKRVPVQSNGLKTYLGWATFDPNDFSGVGGPHNPAGLYAMIADSALQSYPYLADPSVLGIAVQALDYQLAHGLTSDGWSWGHVPYASADVGATSYRGSDDSDCGNCGSGDGVGVIEPDKVGEEGYAYLRVWEQTGNATYRDAAITFANVLAAHVRSGDSTHSPWPFRVRAQTNEVREEYTADVLGPIMLFDELIRLGLGNVGQYQSARQTAWSWMMSNPMRNNGWSQYFEDVPIQSDPLNNVNQYIPLRTASYIMHHPQFDSNWQTDVPKLLAWVEQKFADPQYGAEAVSEQERDMDKMGSHTSRYASVAAEWAEVSGDGNWKEKAFRSFNWASYMVHSNGVVSVGVDGSSGWWFSDGYGDYIRHFIAGMGAMPEWAPPGANHLLRSTSVVQSITYGSSAVSYRTFDADATEVLRLSFAPGAITSGGQPLAQRNDLSAAGYTLQSLGGDVVVRIRHTASGDISITGGGTPPPPPAPAPPPPPAPAPPPPAPAPPPPPAPAPPPPAPAPPPPPAPAPPPPAPAPPPPAPAAPPPAPAAEPPAPAPAAEPAQSAAPSATQTITFDDVDGSSVNAELDGQFPDGVIDWGSGTWYLSGPWQALSNNSVSFNGEGISNATFTFVTPRQLLRLDAYNGDDSPTTLTLSCPGQSDQEVSLDGNEVRTIETNWGDPCSSVTISSANGWETNFQNLVIQ